MSLTARIARSDASLLRLRGNAPIPVMVRFDVDPIASYAGGIAGFPATSPGLIGFLRAHPADVRAYERFLSTRMATIAGAIRRTVPAAHLLRTFSIVYGGASLLVPAGQIRDLLTVPGVVAVQRDDLAHTTSTTTRFLGADRVWPGLGGPQLAANDVGVGVIDTGIWPEHPSFADLGLGNFPLVAGCEFGDGSDPDFGAPFDCDRKLIGAYAFTDTYMSLIGAWPGEFCDNDTGKCSARSGDGHGTHTASTAAGSPTKASVFGLPRGRVSGIAPGARLIAYRVCLSLGCYGSDSVSAIEQAVLDGVDVINFSISGGADPYSDPVELAFLDAYAAGIQVNASAGNAGPGPGTADHGGPWVTTVGASYGPRAYMTALRLRGADGATVRLPGSTITRGVAGKTVVSAADVAGYEDPLCSSPMDPGTVTDRVVVCARGKVPRVEKSWNVRRGGGAGMILFNPTHEDLFTDNFWIPTVMLDGPEPANTLLAFLGSHAGVISTWRTGTATSNHADQMTLFSARGPVGGFIKPDVTAPGLQVLAGAAPKPADPAAGPRGQLFQSMAGTSMSSPYAAGVAALVRASHPRWSAGQVKSALMTSTLQTVTKEDGTTSADPFDGGAGSIRADRAVRPTLTFDVPAADYVAATDPLGWVDLNLPSVDVIGIRGELATARYGRNVSGSAQTFSASVTAPVGATITVTSPDWRVEPGETLEIDVRINASGLAEGQYFGGITLEPASTAHEIFLPVAFTRMSGSMRSAGAITWRSLRPSGRASRLGSVRV
jgi:subtilisin family serine protease